MFRLVRRLAIWGSLAATLVSPLPAAGEGPGVRGKTGASSAVKAADREKLEIAAIREAASNYVKALEAGNKEMAAASWTSKGDYIDAAGNSFKARDLFARMPAKASSEHKAEWHMTVGGIRLATPDVAIEDGRIDRPAAMGMPAAATRYTAVWVKHDKSWLLDSLREAALPQAPRNARFDDLAWLLGEFSGRSAEGTHVVMSGMMSRDGNFLMRQIMVTAPDGREHSLSQRIGWDPLAGRFKSWTFLSDGGYGEGMWKREGQSWIVNSTEVSPEGKRSSATGIYSQITPDGMTLLFSGATEEGEPRPDLKFKLKRETAK